MKKKLCYVTNNYDQEWKKKRKALAKKYHKNCQMSKSLFVNLVTQINLQTKLQLRRNLYKNIILSGGNEIFPELAEKMSKELKFLSPQPIKILVVVLPDRKSSIVLMDQSYHHCQHSKPCESQEMKKRKRLTIVRRKCFFVRYTLITSINLSFPFLIPNLCFTQKLILVFPLNIFIKMHTLTQKLVFQNINQRINIKFRIEFKSVLLDFGNRIQTIQNAL
ncbi:unnamed protein product [Paramecium sonneborni]|uniref:Uncharacterized protein n=1 Tax=Paramecium sonneborni TaxID=65129 RepID=A0A8S1NS82_9CILI|nr:unnamed protein product [Paramecium sonneborni]